LFLAPSQRAGGKARASHREGKPRSNGSAKYRVFRIPRRTTQHPEPTPSLLAGNKPPPSDLYNLEVEEAFSADCVACRRKKGQGKAKLRTARRKKARHWQLAIGNYTSTFHHPEVPHHSTDQRTDQRTSYQPTSASESRYSHSHTHFLLS
jgi:hypothetical protein